MEKKKMEERKKKRPYRTNRMMKTKRKHNIQYRKSTKAPTLESTIGEDMIFVIYR